LWLFWLFPLCSHFLRCLILILGWVSLSAWFLLCYCPILSYLSFFTRVMSSNISWLYSKNSQEGASRCFQSLYLFLMSFVQETNVKNKTSALFFKFISTVPFILVILWIFNAIRSNNFTIYLDNISHQGDWLVVDKYAFLKNNSN
jgi:hypothetical protein